MAIPPYGAGVGPPPTRQRGGYGAGSYVPFTEGSSAGRGRSGGARWQPRGAGRGQQSRLQCPRCLQQHAEVDCPARRMRCYRCRAVGHVRAACTFGGASRLQRLSEPELEAFQDGDEGAYLLDQEPWEEADTTYPAEMTPTAPEGFMTTGGNDSLYAHQGMDVRENMLSRESGEDSRKGVGEEDAYFLFRSQEAEMSGRKPPLCVDVLVNDKPVCLELDTGAALSVCSEQEYRRIWPVDGPVIHSCDKVLKTYSGETLPVVGKAQVQVRYGVPGCGFVGDRPERFGAIPVWSGLVGQAQTGLACHLSGVDGCFHGRAGD